MRDIWEILFLNKIFKFSLGIREEICSDTPPLVSIAQRTFVLLYAFLSFHHLSSP
jgi:hypothetical protein